MKVFTVLMTDDYMKKLTMEHYSVFELALTRACSWCHEVYGVTGNHNPKAQDCGDGSTVEYVVYRGDEEDVFISVIELEVLTAIPHFRGDFVTMDGDLSGSTSPQTIVAIVAPVDDPREASLPAGWDYEGLPIRMETLLDDADCVRPMNELSDKQQWALTIARVSKRPNFSWSTPQGVFVQSSALHELKNKTMVGHNIRVAEMDYLDKLRQENCVVDMLDDNYDDSYNGYTT